jgi:2-polyprenyl-3-methyl-5-hydroxy-6-metoxy-1,4-benzoquinol methylase
MNLYCPLCAGRAVQPYHRDRRRAYWQCQRCELVFVAPQDYLSAAKERAEYDLHDNAVDDPGYRRFLSRLANPLLARLAPGARGLDFGCGPGPALASMLSEAGMQMQLYDCFYQPHAGNLARPYDFICATEVVEHLHCPGSELQRLWGLLRPGGTLAVMTKLVRGPQAFAQWHYKNDPTHVCFFSRATWRWWAAQRAAELEFVGEDVMLLARPRVS